MHPLRERPDDIALLAFYFLDSYARKEDRGVRTLSHRALQALMAAPWPGNVRELKNSVESACARATGREVVFTWDFPNLRTADASSGQSKPQTIEELERQRIMETLETTNGNITKACRLLGYKSRQTILNKMDRFGIPRTFGDPETSW